MLHEQFHRLLTCIVKSGTRDYSVCIVERLMHFHPAFWAHFDIKDYCYSSVKPMGETGSAEWIQMTVFPHRFSSFSSGICVCKTGVYGPKCDECHPGFFHFSNTGCRPCHCQNHTNYCHPQSGECPLFLLLLRRCVLYFFMMI